MRGVRRGVGQSRAHLVKLGQRCPGGGTDRLAEGAHSLRGTAFCTHAAGCCGWAAGTTSRYCSRVAHKQQNLGPVIVGVMQLVEPIVQLLQLTCKDSGLQCRYKPRPTAERVVLAGSS